MLICEVIFEHNRKCKKGLTQDYKKVYQKEVFTKFILYLIKWVIEKIIQECLQIKFTSENVFYQERMMMSQ